MSPSLLKTGAVFDESGRYRYRLWRVWNIDKPLALWVMLNPSTADAEKDDPTIRRCIDFARRWDYGGIEVVNLYALRATYPADLRACSRAFVDIIGPDNDSCMTEAAAAADLIVCAWGSHPQVRGRMQTVYELLRRWRQPHCLRLTKDGYPGHPLYVPADTIPQPYLQLVQVQL